MKLNYTKYLLNFKIPGGTSRGVLRQKETYFISIRSGDKYGIGECGIFRGLSHDDTDDYEEQLDWLRMNINKDGSFIKKALRDYPSIVFGYEQAMLSLGSEQGFDLFPSDFTSGKDKIPINGLVWMGEKQYMREQIENKLESGFDVIKLKIGAIDFEQELSLLRYIRKQFSEGEIEIRVDANGAFAPTEALEKLKRLSDYAIHSIEQPIRQGQYEEMAALCKVSPVAIALDEELIGLCSTDKREQLLESIKPQYIILKPSLVGGIAVCNDWLRICSKHGIKWWITSALESNIGLNAIAQYTYTLNNPMPQGLGTGGLFTNNIDSPLEVKRGSLHYSPDLKWGNTSHLFEK